MADDKDQDSLEKQLEVAIAALDRQYGKNTVVKLGSMAVETWPSVSTSSFGLDLALGIGGLPKGRIVEIYGPESSGKTTVALSVIAQAQKNNELCVFIDAEHALDPGYAQKLGVDIEKLYISQPDFGEQALEIVDRLLRTGAPKVIVVDSVAALVPKSELEGEMGHATMGSQARLMSQAIRKIVALTNEHGTLVIFINQLREKLGIMFGNPETTPGGRALKFFSSVRIDVRKKADLTDKSDGQRKGITVKANVVKNKMAPPYRTATFDIIYGEGISQYGSIIDVALEKGVLTSAGSWIKYEGEAFAQGRERAMELLASKPELSEEIKQKIIEKIKK